MADRQGSQGSPALWAPSTLVAGTDFEIISHVDSGELVQTYCVRRVDTRHVFSLKAFVHGGPGDLVSRLQGQVREGAKIHLHPNVGGLLGAGETAGRTPYLLSGWLDGQSARRVLMRRRGFGPDEAHEVVMAALSALAKAHSVGIGHFDVRPESLILCSDGLVKLVDFGVATALYGGGPIGVSGLSASGLRYLSPEIVSGRPATLAHDLYSLGVTLWEMLAGEHPFPQREREALVKAIVEDGVPPLERLPAVAAKTTPALRQLVERACARDPAARFASAEAFADAFDEAIGRPPSGRSLAMGVYPTGRLIAPSSGRMVAAPVRLSTRPPGAPSSVRPPGVPPSARPPEAKAPSAPPPEARPGASVRPADVMNDSTASQRGATAVTAPPLVREPMPSGRPARSKRVVPLGVVAAGLVAAFGAGVIGSKWANPTQGPSVEGDAGLGSRSSMSAPSPSAFFSAPRASDAKSATPRGGPPRTKRGRNGRTLLGPEPE